MCTAQVLLLNRDVMRRNFGGDVNRRVCRKLFESNEPNTPSVFLKKMQEEIRKKDSERWNFDFMTETPLPGRYQWEPIFAATNSISKLQTTTAGTSRDERRSEPIVDEITTSTTLKRKRKSAGASSSQHKITEFITKKKKLSTDETSSSSSKFKIRRVNRNTSSLASTTRLR